MPVKYTNKHNLPESFVNAVLVDEHVSLGDISVTQLIDAPQIRMLKRTNEYEMDVMDMIGMVMGTGMHTVLERGDMAGTFEARVLQRAAGVLRKHGEDKGADYLIKMIKDKLEESIDSNILVEQTLTIEVLGWTVSGTFDRFDKALKRLQDYKQTGANSVMFPDLKKSWNAQQNIYAVMIRESLELEVEGAEIIAVLKDWSKMKIMTNRDYPKTPVVRHEIPMIPHEDVMKYIKKRVRLHQRAEGGEHIPCTPKDRWAKADTYAVFKHGGKKATKVCATLKEAEAYVEGNEFKYPKGLIIKHRKAESFRCANGYCSVSEFCPQYKKEREEAALVAQEDM